MVKIAMMVAVVLAMATPALAASKSGATETYADISTLVWRYYDALADPRDGTQLQGILDPSWHIKYERDGALAMEEKDAYITRIVAAGENPEARLGLSLTSVQAFYDDYAMARMDARSRAGAIFFTLFKTDGQWRIASKVISGAEYGKQELHMSAETATDEVLAVMEKYYRAVEFGQPDDLLEVFDDGWHMKNPVNGGEYVNPNGGVYAEGKERFIARVDGRPLPGYYDNRQVTDVQVLYDHLAVVRIDNPTTRSTTMFTYMRLGRDWKMIDKSWGFVPQE